MTQSAEDFISALVRADKASVSKLMQTGLTSDIFPTPYSGIVKFCLEYYSKYGAIPTIMTLSERFGSLADSLSMADPAVPIAALYDKVADEGIRSALVDFSTGLQTQYNDKENDGPELLEYIGTEIREINAKYARAKGEVSTFSEMVPALKKEYEDRSKGLSAGIPIPFLFIQEEMNGWQRSELTSIAGKTGIGKTWFLILSAAAAAAGDPYMFYRPRDKSPYTEEQKKAAQARVLIVSFEMEVMAFARRLACILTNTSYRKVRASKLTDAEKLVYFDKLDSFGVRNGDKTFSIGENMKILGPGSCTTSDQIHAQAEDYGADMVCVDGFYYMDGEGDERWKHIQSNMKEMRLHTLKTARHYLLTTQLSKEVTSLKTATTSAMSFSQSIAQDSNNVILLHQLDQMKQAKQINVKLGKIRDGESNCPFRYEWDFNLMLFAELGEETSASQGSVQSAY
jgi:replicative DNA helicase